MTELERLNVLKTYQILDTPFEQEFDSLTEIASAICDVPISLITFLDSERQWFKAMKGIGVRETAREHSICHYAIQQPKEVMEVQDLLRDDRFSSNPFVVGEPQLRFYAGVPIVTSDNVPLGTVCIMDQKPRKLSKAQRKILKILAGRVVNLLELRKENLLQKKKIKSVESQLNRTLDRLIEAQHIAQIGSWDWNLKTDQVYWSPEMYEIYGLEQIKDGRYFDRWKHLVHQEDLPVVETALARGVETKSNENIEYRIIKADGRIEWLETRGYVVLDKKGSVARIAGTTQNVTKRKNAELEKRMYANTLSDMLFDLSHKIRQPLTNSLGLVSVFNDLDVSKEELKKFAGYLNVSVQKIDEYVRDMSDYIYANKEKIAN